MSKGMLIISGLIVMVWLLAVFVFDFSDGKLGLYVLDVGQGDAILVRMPDRSTMLIDGGGGSYVLSRLGEILPPWKRKIDIIVLTHPHADHLFGLLDVVERYEIGEVWLNPACYELHEYEFFMKMLSEKGVRTVWVSEISNEIVEIGGVEVQIYPWNLVEKGVRDPEIFEFLGKCGEEGENEADYENINNSSVVIHLNYGHTSILLTGDAEVEVEKALVKSRFRRIVSETDILKAGHHCSRTASSEDFLKIVEPDIAICSCGLDNSFGHPHKETLDIFDSLGVNFLRTDEDGSIAIISDGTDWWVK